MGKRTARIEYSWMAQRVAEGTPGFGDWITGTSNNMAGLWLVLWYAHQCLRFDGEQWSPNQIMELHHRDGQHLVEWFAPLIAGAVKP